MNVDRKLALLKEITGYDFENDLLAVESIQMAGPNYPVLMNGQIHMVHPNKRMAVLGDAKGTAVLCDQWHRSQDKFG